MKRIIIYVMASAALLFTACHSLPDYDNDPKGNFDALWSELDQHYCFFDEKQIDWDAVYQHYSAKIQPNMTGEELFRVCSGMLDELHDGHVNLSSPYGTSYYRGWWSEYPQNYNARLIEQYYFNFNYTTLGSLDYGLLSDNIAYIHYSSFNSAPGEGNLDYVLSYLSTAQALIFDVRDNGGGDLTNVERLVSRFITKRTYVGSISHKTGPGHNEFSDPYDIYYSPVDPAMHVSWIKPVVVLTNRSTFSAANNFVSIMKHIPGVSIIGATTGGGCGMPYSSEMPNGWGIRMSAVLIRDAQGNLTEEGVEPSEGCSVDMQPMDEISGHDTILDFAIDYITSTL